MNFQWTPPLKPDEGVSPDLRFVVDTVGADIFVRLVVDRVDVGGSVEESELRWMTDVALSAAALWGLRRHQLCEPCSERPAP